jgi:hypothetical protein
MLRILASLCFALIGHAAGAGVVLTTEQSNGQGGVPRESKAYLEPDRLKITMPRGALIYRADQNQILQLDDQRQSFVQMTPEQVRQMQASVGGVVGQVRQGLQFLPESQRRQLEQMLARRGMGQAGGPPPQVSYLATGDRESFGRWRCERYERLENGAKTDDLCLARQSDLKLTQDDLGALRRLAGFAQGLGEVAARAGAGAFDFDGLQQAAGFDAFPVHIVHYRDGDRAHEMTLKAVVRTSIAPGTFEVPEGYARREFGMR